MLSFLQQQHKKNELFFARIVDCLYYYRILSLGISPTIGFLRPFAANLIVSSILLACA